VLTRTELNYYNSNKVSVLESTIAWSIRGAGTVAPFEPEALLLSRPVRRSEAVSS